MKLYPLSMVGGILGLISLGLPWLAATSTGFFQSSQSVSGFQLLSIQSQLGNTSGPASTALLLMVVGVILTLIGAIIAFLHPAGGGVALGGGACGLAGALWLGSLLAQAGGGGFGLTIGPSFGLYLTIAAGVVSLVGLAMPMRLGAAAYGQPGMYGYPSGYPPNVYPAPYPQAYVQVPQYGPTAYPAPPAQAPGPYGPPPATASQAPGAPAPAPTFAAVNVLPPTQDATPPVNPPADLPMAAPGTAVANPLFVCPSCGRKGPEAFCTEDGTRMGPSPEIA